MKKIQKGIISEIGSLSIEGAIALTAFLFMFIMVYSIISIGRAQAKIQIGINATAKELSQYSYVYGMSKLSKKMSDFQADAKSEQEYMNQTIKVVLETFDSIQGLGEAGVSSNVGNIDGLIDNYDEIIVKSENIKDNMTELKEEIEKIAKEPQKLLLGIAKIIGSEALELAKSRLIAESVSKALMDKHLKRSNSDTAEAFCRSVSIVPNATTMSYFDGIDFSNSTLFPYGLNKITIVANYKVKLLQLLPLDFGFHITQSASTRGWMPGTSKESTFSNESDLIGDYINNSADSIWNTASLADRVELMRSLGIADLKKEGYYGIKGETYIQAYDPTTNSFAMVSSSNPLYGLKSINDIDKNEIKEYLKSLSAQIRSSTDTKQTIKISKKDSNGNIITEEIKIDTGQPKNLKIVVVIPEDEGLKSIYEEIAVELGSKVSFEFREGFGRVIDNGGN